MVTGSLVWYMCQQTSPRPLYGGIGFPRTPCGLKPFPYFPLRGKYPGRPGRLQAPISISGAFECQFITARLTFLAIFDNLRVVNDGGVVILGLICRCTRHQLRQRSHFRPFLSPWASSITATDTFWCVFVTMHVVDDGSGHVFGRFCYLACCCQAK